MLMSIFHKCMVWNGKLYNGDSFLPLTKLGLVVKHKTPDGYYQVYIPKNWSVEQENNNMTVVRDQNGTAVIIQWTFPPQVTIGN